MLELIPDRPALCRESTCTVDLLVRLSPELERHDAPRPLLNLSLVIDRSGSMGGQKIVLTREAAATVVRSMQPEDLLSIVLFDDQIDVLYPCSPVQDKEAVVRLLQQAQARGNTALFDGWRNGAEQANRGRDDRRLNRVVVLTDGQANTGETNVDRICTQVHGYSQRGVQCTTLGFGNDYNEQLLRSMAASGNGNHFYVQTPEQLGSIFQQELTGLTATIGTSVRLRLEATREGVQIEPLGEIQPTPEGDYQLADLVAEVPLEQLFRLTVPAGEDEDAGVLVEVSWHSPKSGQTERCSARLRLPRVSVNERLNMPVNEVVEEKQAVAQAARSRREAMQALNAGEKERAAAILEEAIQTRKLPLLEKSQLQQLQATMKQGDQSASNKMFTSQSYSYSRGSVTMSAIEVALAQQLVMSGQVDVQLSSFFEGTPSFGPIDRAVGMVAGLFAGSGPSGQAAELTLALLPLIGAGQRFVQIFMQMQKAVAETPVTHPLPSQEYFARLWRDTQTLTPSDAPDWGALARVPSLLVNNWKRPSSRFWHQVLVSTSGTHNHGLSVRACLAGAALLAELSSLPTAPAPGFYLSRFAEALYTVETATEYESPLPRYDGWKGKFSAYLEMTLAEARGLSWEEAARLWGGGDHLMSVVPAWLYLLEHFGDQPGRAFQLASGWPGVATLTGAALGALHGRHPDWQLTPDQEKAVQQLEQDLS